jgi:hypothetical protein
MSWLLHHTYWRFRHWLWDAREHLLVREIARHMRMQGGTKALYVHEYDSDPASWVVVPVPFATTGLEPHGHIEGPPRES